MQNIMIVEDHPLVAEATKALLSGTARVGRIATFSTAEQVRNALATERTFWSLILLDLDVPGAVGLSLAAHIKQAGLAPITCILTGTYREDYVMQARKDGFLGYILKASRTADLEQSLRSVLQHQQVFTPLGGEAIAKGLITLTQRQKEVLQLVGSGLTSKEIAKKLQLTPGTVDNHITASIAALDAHTRSEAVTKALALGFVRAAS